MKRPRPLMQISFQNNIRQVERGLSDFARREVPFATSLALNATADDVLKNTSVSLRKRLDRPTPFTEKAFRATRSSKSRLSVKVFAMDRQAAYLKFQEDGGTRKPNRKAIAIPVNIETNEFGNIPRRGIKRTLKLKNVFSGVPKGAPKEAAGIYKRVGATAKKKAGYRLLLLIDYAKRTIYRPRLRFKSSAAKTAAARFPIHWERSIKRAIATARR